MKQKIFVLAAFAMLGLGFGVSTSSHAQAGACEQVCAEEYASCRQDGDSELVCRRILVACRTSCRVQ